MLSAYATTTFPGNPIKFSIPRAISLLMLYDPLTGVPLAIVGNTLISQMRVGAETGVAAQYLARKNSEVAAVVGASVQGTLNIMA